MTDFLKNKKNALGLLVVLLVGVLLGYWLRSEDRTQAAADLDAAVRVHANHLHATSTSPAAVPLEEPAEDILYVCPMMCVPPQEQPGDCPVCGMELVPTPAGDKAGPPRLRLAPETVKLARIRTAPVERQNVATEVRLFGQIDYDPAHTANITAFMPGVIDRVYVKRAGQFVRWGDPLFDVYSSDLFSTMQQLVDAMNNVPSFYSFREGRAHIAKDSPITLEKNDEKDAESASSEIQVALKTIEAVRSKLRILGLPKRDIDELMKASEPTGIATVYASMYGQVIEQNAFEGTYVNTGATVFRIADPEFVWARLDAYEADYPWLRKGQQVSFVTDAYPGETFKGEVVYIDPVFNTKTRTFSIGALSPHTAGRLKAGMLVRAVIHAQLSADGAVSNGRPKIENAPLVVPASAPLITGKRAVVYVALPGEEGLYEGREVVLGPKASGYYVVTAGLEEGEQVVVNGNFKIDSQIQIMAKSSMMSIEGGHSATAHAYHGGSPVVAEDYFEERKESRMRRAGPAGSAIPTVNSEVERIKPLHGERPSNAPSTHRRRPGMYGDATRRIPSRRGE